MRRRWAVSPSGARKVPRTSARLCLAAQRSPLASALRVRFYCGNNYFVTKFDKQNVLLTDPDERFLAWVTALEARHMSNLTTREVGRALRALSSCYVERRTKLTERGALDSAGKRAAFALFYGPVHFLIAREVIRALQAAPVTAVTDLGCGTGAAGAAWALESGGIPVTGFDSHPWAVSEAAWTYRLLGLEGRASQQNVARASIRVRPGSAVLAAYVVNELSSSERASLLPTLLDAHSRSARVLVMEPIARKIAPWWSDWSREFSAAGGRSDEWRFPARLPRMQMQLARSAGLEPRELTARTLYL